MGNGRFEVNPDQEPFGARFVDFGGLEAGNYKRLLGALGNSRFGPNPGQEPLGGRFGKTGPGFVDVVDFVDFEDQAGAGTWGISAASPQKRGG